MTNPTWAQDADTVVGGETNKDVDGRAVNPIWKKGRHQTKREPIGRGERTGQIGRVGEGGRCGASWGRNARGKIGSEDKVKGRWV